LGFFLTNEPLGSHLIKNDSEFRQVVNVGLMDAIASGKYFELYEKWFGPKSDVPYPLAPETKRFLEMQVVPK
jgi:polar amino acid transport system substrate-binding protein